MRAQAGVVNNRKLLLSRMEAEDLQERDLLCPVCGFRIQTLYSDASGHLRVKCPRDTYFKPCIFSQDKTYWKLCEAPDRRV